MSRTDEAVVVDVQGEETVNALLEGGWTVLEVRRTEDGGVEYEMRAPLSEGASSEVAEGVSSEEIQEAVKRVNEQMALLWRDRMRQVSREQSEAQARQNEIRDALAAFKTRGLSLPEYINVDLRERREEPGDVWQIQVRGERVHLWRLSEGKVVEAYAPVSRERAVINAAAFIQGYQPPRNLVRLDKYSGQTPSEPPSESAV